MRTRLFYGAAAAALALASSAYAGEAVAYVNVFGNGMSPAERTSDPNFSMVGPNVLALTTHLQAAPGEPYKGDAASTVSSTGANGPYLDVLVHLYDNPTPQDGYAAEATANLTYQITTNIPVGVNLGDIVPTLMTTNSFVTLNGVQQFIQGYAFGTTQLHIGAMSAPQSGAVSTFDGTFISNCAQTVNTACPPVQPLQESFSGDVLVYLPAGVPVTINMGARVHVTQYIDTLASAEAFVDPVFNIDPAYLLAHPDASVSLYTPPPPPPPVPEPATWGVMLTGMGLTGAVLRRRRQAVTA